eukprot:TRINITY_DN1110_c0_g1_i1.p1 TRINITY_DN1110_c0_g1~~TRINITY_DN1110_c0_g1_i1.p1  ORF type:complete len:268 (-),score=79.19 TRINITY_DN1110_c0_g1_i1:168-971(-)
MADNEDTDQLLEFIKSVNWEDHIEHDEIREAVIKIRNVIEGAPEDGEEEDDDIANTQRIKLVVVGDGAVGKTSLLISYATDKFPEDYVPTVFENYTAQTKIDGESILLHLWDTAGQEDYDRLRPLSYPGADIVLLCFSTVSPPSYESIKVKWFPEVHHYVPSVPNILVGTKLDLRVEEVPNPDTGKFEPVTQEQGEEMAKEIKAIKYMEISAKTREGLNALFETCVKTVLSIRAAAAGDTASASPEATAHVEEQSKAKAKKKTCMLL